MFMALAVATQAVDLTDRKLKGADALGSKGFKGILKGNNSKGPRTSKAPLGGNGNQLSAEAKKLNRLQKHGVALTPQQSAILTQALASQAMMSLRSQQIKAGTFNATAWKQANQALKKAAKQMMKASIAHKNAVDSAKDAHLKAVILRQRKNDRKKAKRGAH
jgi:hypothetical protein